MSGNAEPGGGTLVGVVGVVGIEGVGVGDGDGVGAGAGFPAELHDASAAEAAKTEEVRRKSRRLRR